VVRSQSTVQRQLRGESEHPIHSKI
jgi:hypothetical protein